jgi:Xaa-Pro aminopeptidase
MNLDAIQAALRDSSLDGWLFYDHHHRDPIATRILGIDPQAHVTRRWYYFIPAKGEPRKLVHRIEQGRLDALPGSKVRYSSWQELHAGLEAMLQNQKKIAMQYSPSNDIMYVSMVDAGTVEFLRSLGKEIVTSADLVSQFEAVLSEEQVASHQAAQRAIDPIVAEAWLEIGRRLRPPSGSAGGAGRTGGLSEWDMVVWLSEAMHREGLVWENGPDVSVNANTSDSHYEPTAERSAPIREGDFLLIDIWGRQDKPGSIFYDITWTGVIGREPSANEQVVFETVRSARDAAIARVEQAFTTGRVIRGFEADDAARNVIRDAGFGEFFTHRTGHNIAIELHGSGAHLDNLETHDVRRILPRTCFSVEPGIYLPEFGVRSEVNMLTAPGKAWVTGRIQQDLVRI